MLQTDLLGVEVRVVPTNTVGTIRAVYCKGENHLVFLIVKKDKTILEVVASYCVILN